MSKMVVKDNVLIQASYSLDTVEQRLILLAIAEARETGQGISENSLLEVHASSYINTFNVEKHTAYTVLKEASRSLFDRYVTYHDINPKTGRDRSFHCRWVDKIGYEQHSGIVFLRFTQDIVPLITRLEENFTRYELQQVACLTSTYAIRLYELLVQWRSAGKTPILALDTFRMQLGVEHGQYKTMSNFKKFVLDFAIQQINEHTDITVKYEQHKQGRTITGFSFNFKQKPKSDKGIIQKDKNTIDMFETKDHQVKFIKMSDAQLDTFSGKLSELHEIQAMAHVGEDMKPFTARLRSMLKDPEQQIKLQPYLEQVGFKLGKS